MKRKVLILLILVAGLVFTAPLDSVIAECQGDCCGTVTDTDGAPLEGVTVNLKLTSGDTDTVYTNDEGVWDWDARDATGIDYASSIVFSKDGYTSYTCYTLAVGLQESCDGSGSLYCEDIETTLSAVATPTPTPTPSGEEPTPTPTPTPSGEDLTPTPTSEPPPNTREINCSGIVIDATDSSYLEGVYVYISVVGIGLQHPCLDCNDPRAGEEFHIAVTDENGQWSYNCNCWPNQWAVDNLTFEKDGYLQANWYNSPEIDDPYGCNSDVIQMEPEGTGFGWKCVNHGAPDPEDRCEQVVGGNYSSEQSCIMNCNYFMCDTGACVDCDPEYNICPYKQDPTCNNECEIGDEPIPLGPFCPIGDDPKGGINTAIGCIPIEYSGLASWILTFSFGIAGGIAFLLMVYGGFLVITAGGQVKKVQSGKELITSAVGGLILIIFSIFILRLIGIRLFQIPGLD